MNHEGHEDHEAIPAEVERLGRVVVDSALKVHKALGPGLLESAYEHCLVHELTVRGVSLRRQAGLPIHYDGAMLDAGYRLDLLVHGAIIVEVKAVDALAPLHQAQLLTYLKLRLPARIPDEFQRPALQARAETCGALTSCPSCPSW